MKDGIYITRAQTLRTLQPLVGVPPEVDPSRWITAKVEPSGVHVVPHQNFEAARIAALAEGKRRKLQVIHLRSTRLL